MMAGEIVLLEGFETLVRDVTAQESNLRLRLVEDSLELKSGRSGGTSVTTPDQVAKLRADAPSGSFTTHCALYYDHDRGFYEFGIMLFLDEDANKVVNIGPSDTIGDDWEVVVNGDVEDTFESPVGSGQWFRLECVVDRSEESVQVIIDNTVMSTVSVGSVINDIAQCEFRAQFGAFSDSTDRIRLDDVVIREGVTPLGDVSIVPLDLVDNGAHADLEPEPDDEDPWDVVTGSTSEYLVSDSTDGVQRHTFEVDKDSVPEGFTPLAIQVDTIARIGEGGGSGTYRVATRIGGTDYDHDEQTLGSSYTSRAIHHYPINPTTNDPWTRDDLDSFEVGVWVDLNDPS